MIDSRKDERMCVEYAGTFSAGFVRGKGVIVDLSIGGCRVSSASPVKKGDLMGVLIELPRFERSLYIIKTVVRWTNAREFGLEFLLMDLRDRQRLDALLPHAGLAAGISYGGGAVPSHTSVAGQGPIL